MMMKKILLLTLTVLISLPILAQFHSETSDGDLSDQFDVPTGPFILSLGEQTLTASQQSDDVDYVSISIPEGFVLEALILVDYTVENANNQAFLGMQEGLAFTTDAVSTTASDLLGGVTYGSQNLDTNLLVPMNNIGQGFDIPLAAGDYTFWLNQTGPNSEATLNFVVMENLGVEQNDLVNRVQLFPNPVKDVLMILSHSSLQIEKFSMIDLSGKIVRSFSNPTSVNLSDLAKGIYFGKVETNQGSFTKKIVKL